ncbi:hypothetical protein [uncultured Bradyrhizobium sp.]|uniref:hypothetical protein n=1 Tax=uncultured Bradyrhizobium sp. TaxID=199684 RepID=UPI0035CC4C46
MSDRINQSSEAIDHPISRSICYAIGERLQQNLRPDNARLPSHLQRLMDELQRRDYRD